jgi:hypothetical protein
MTKLERRGKMVTVIVLTMVAYMMCHTHWVVVVKNIPTHTSSTRDPFYTFFSVVVIIIVATNRSSTFCYDATYPLLRYVLGLRFAEDFLRKLDWYHYTQSRGQYDESKYATKGF